MLDYLDELYRRLPSFASRAAAIRRDKPGSVAWFQQVGRFWWDARESQGLSRYAIASKMGIHVNLVRFLELDIPGPDEVSHDILKKYSQALGTVEGQPSFYDEFRTRFNIKEDKPGK